MRKTSGDVTLELAERQLSLDVERTRRLPALLGRKYLRMRESPFAFLRGSCPLFNEMLQMWPRVRDEGPPGKGWLTGDLHLENFGAYRPGAMEKGRAAGRAVFDLNDFDEAWVGPWRLDVLRLTVSLILAGRELGSAGIATLDLAHALLRGYVRGQGGGKRPKEPRAIGELVAKVERRSERALLEGRARLHGKKHRFVIGPRYMKVDDGLREQAIAAFARYARSLPRKHRPDPAALEVEDVALRVAGTGSLGALRFALLVRGKGRPHGAWIFDAKEEGAPAGAPHLRTKDAADRVIEAVTRCLDAPPRLLGKTRIGKTSMLVRRLTPQEDKLELASLPPAELPEIAAYLGDLVARAHVRGATDPPRRAWKERDIGTILSNAVFLAGVHEAVYLAFCEHLRDPRFREMMAPWERK